MQGTVVMLMALSGLGCHNKSCDVVYAPPAYSCFSGGCYANVYPPDYVRRRVTRGVIRAATAAATRDATAAATRRLRRTSWMWAFCQAL